MADTGKPLSHAEVESGYRRMLTERRQALRPDDPDLTINLLALASVLKQRDERDESEALFREALDIRRRALPSGDLYVGTAAAHLARLLEECGRFREAEPLYREALTIFRALAPDDNRHVILSVRNLAAVLQELGGDTNLTEAESLLRDAARSAMAALQPDDPGLAECLSDLGALLTDRSKLDESESWLRIALELRRDRPGDDSVDLANVLVRTARLRLAQDRHADAEQAAREALDIRRRAYAPGDHRTAKAQSLLGLALVGLGKFAEAEAALLAAYDVLTTRQPPLPAGPPRVADTVARIVRLYEAWGRPDRAAAWRGRRPR
jgi:tetratricopeptide (TPR) repeat protein